MIKYFCNFCGSEVEKNSDMPCGDCLELLTATLQAKQTHHLLKLGAVAVLLPSALFGEMSDAATTMWFKAVLPTLKEFSAAITPPDDTRSATEPTSPPNKTGDSRPSL